MELNHKFMKMDQGGSGDGILQAKFTCGVWICALRQSKVKDLELKGYTNSVERLWLDPNIFIAATSGATSLTMNISKNPSSYADVPEHSTRSLTLMTIMEMRRWLSEEKNQLCNQLYVKVIDDKASMTMVSRVKSKKILKVLCCDNDGNHFNHKTIVVDKEVLHRL